MSDPVSGRSAVWVLVVVPPGNVDSVLVAWRGDVIEEDVREVGPEGAMEGLEDPETIGAWVFEGWLVRRAYRCNHPEDPEEWDTVTHWEGAWRRPTTPEIVAALLVDHAGGTARE